MPSPKPAFRRTAQLRERLARSSRFFLLGLVVACGVEVLVDWNSTLSEIAILRDHMRERGSSYVSILSKSAAGPMRDRDPAWLGRLSEGLFDDEDVVFVRFVDPAEAVLYERLSPAFGQAFAAERGVAFDAYYAKQLARDTRGAMTDPEGERLRMAQSKYRDVAQRWSEGLAALAARISPPPPARAPSRVLYQEALRTAVHTRDEAVTYAFASVSDEGGSPVGAAVVAFSMARTNASIQRRYLKGAGMVVFFVGLILAQNLVTRRDKLRLLDLETRYAAAKLALRQALPAPRAQGALQVAVALDQAEGAVDGVLVEVLAAAGGLELLAVDPDGEGIDAAAVALHLVACFRARPEALRSAPLAEQALALGQAALQIPLTRPVGVLLLRVEADGSVHGLSSPVGGVRLLQGGRVEPLSAGAPTEAPPGLVGPLTPLSGALAPGGTLLSVFDGLGEGDLRRHVDLEAVAAFLLRSVGPTPERLVGAVGDAVSWTRGRSPSLSQRDLLVLALGRRG